MTILVVVITMTMTTITMTAITIIAIYTTSLYAFHVPRSIPLLTLSLMLEIPERTPSLMELPMDEPMECMEWEMLPLAALLAAALGLSTGGCTACCSAHLTQHKPSERNRKEQSRF